MLLAKKPYLGVNKAMEAPMTPSDKAVELGAQALYERAPYFEPGEYIEGFLVSPGGNLTWEQAEACDAEFSGVGVMLPILQPYRDDARAALSAAAPAMREANAMPGREEIRREQAWLIERHATYATSYGPTPDWSTDPWRAEQYKTYDEAEFARLQISFDQFRNEARSTLHLFLYEPEPKDNSRVHYSRNSASVPAPQPDMERAVEEAREFVRNLWRNKEIEGGPHYEIICRLNELEKQFAALPAQERTWQPIETNAALLIDNIVRDVAELPDRTSPEDDPDTMLVSHSELRNILWLRLHEAPTPFVDASPAPPHVAENRQGEKS